VTLTLATLAALVLAALAVATLVSVKVTVKAGGVLEPVRVWPVRAREPGTVGEVLVSTGDRVRAGQPVARLDALQLEASLAELRGQFRAAELDARRAASAAPVEERQQSERVAQAGARVVTARATLRQRMTEYDLGGDVDSLLAEYRAGRHVAVDLAVAELRSAESEVRHSSAQGEILGLGRFERERKLAERDQLAARIRAAEERISRLALSAPTAGVVLTDQVERLPGSYVREGELLLEVADLDAWRVSLYVGERDVQRIRVGDSVRVRVQAFGAERRDDLRGSVGYVSPEPLGSGGAGGGAAPAQGGAAPAGPGQYRVLVRLDQRQLAGIGIHRFRRGYTAEGQIVTRSGRIIVLARDYLHDRIKGTR
jgi:multidrug resistance efflux pump